MRMIPDLGFNIGDRIEVSDHRGTVKYIGEVVGTKGKWLGVDWDDPTRGKHDGSHNNIIYFKASHPYSGSFVRANKVTPRISCCDAIRSRYGLILENAGVDSEIISQCQKGIKASLFEVVGAEKVNKKQSDLACLRVVSLRGQPIYEAGPPDSLRLLCPSIEELDLSRTLINSWAAVANIAAQLPHLKLLGISENYLQIDETIYAGAFDCLEQLVLAHAKCTWSDVISICRSISLLKNLQIPHNDIKYLENADHVLSALVSLHLEGNSLIEWCQINKLGTLKNLMQLNVSGCKLTSVHFPNDSENTTALFPSLHQLIISENEISDWMSISELDKLQSLEELRCLKNPFLTSENNETNDQLIIARVQRLQILNGSSVSAEERRGAELDFLKRYGLEYLQLEGEEDRARFHQLHPCYERLVKSYGAPEIGELKKPCLKLKEGLVQVELFLPDEPGAATVRKKLPLNMTVNKLSGLAQRFFHTGYNVPHLSLIYKEMEVPLDNALKDLNYYSVVDGSRIAVRW